MSNAIECGVAARVVLEDAERIAAAAGHLEAGGADVFELTLCVPSEGVDGEALFQPARSLRIFGPRGAIQAAAQMMDRLAPRIAAELTAEREAAGRAEAAAVERADGDTECGASSAGRTPDLAGDDGAELAGELVNAAE